MNLINQVTDKDIEQLNDNQFRDLLLALLHAETYYHKELVHCLNVPCKENTADGGEDGRLILNSSYTLNKPFIISHNNIYQIKASDLSPLDCKNELLKEKPSKKNPQPQLKQKVEEALSKNWTYNLFINHSYVQKSLDKRRQAIHKLIIERNFTSNVIILDANIIKNWVNQHPAIIKYVFSLLKRNALPGFLNLSEIKGTKFNQEFYNTNLLRQHAKQIENHVTTFSTHPIRILGNSGIGKTHFIVDTLFNLAAIKHITLYFDLAINDISAAVQFINDYHEYNCLLIVDNCNLSQHKELSDFIKSSLTFKLITIDTALGESSPITTLVIKLEGNDQEEVVKMILKPSLIKYHKEQYLEKLTRICEGYPLLAKLIIGTLEIKGLEDLDLSKLLDTEDIKKLIFGKSAEDEKEKLIISILSWFDYVRFKHNNINIHSLTTDESDYINNQTKFLNENFLTKLSISEQEFSKFCHKYISKSSILEQRGTFIRVRPLPLAASLIKGSIIDGLVDIESILKPALRILCNSNNLALKELEDSFLKRMKFITSPDSDNIVACVNDIWGIASPFGQAENILTSWGSYILRSIVDIAPSLSANLLENAISKLSNADILNITGEARRNFIWLLEKLCFNKDTFYMAAKLLFRFASAENETWSNNSTGQFIHLFQLYLAGTEANYQERIKVLIWALQNRQSNSDIIILKSISQGFHTGTYTRSGGIVTLGAKDFIDYQPKNNQEIHIYWNQLIDIFLMTFEQSFDINDIYDNFTKIILHSLVITNRFSDIELIIEKFKLTSLNVPYISIINKLKSIKTYDTSANKSGINKILAKISPVTLEEKIQTEILNPSIRFDITYEQEAANINLKLAKELINEKDNDSSINLLLHSNSYNALNFGRVLALNDSEFAKKIIEKSMTGLAKNDHTESYYFLSGLLNGLHDSVLFKNTIGKVITKFNYKLAFELTASYQFDIEDFKVLMDIKNNNHLPDEYFAKLWFNHLSLSEQYLILDYFINMGDYGKWKCIEIAAHNIRVNEDEWLSKIWELIACTNMFLIKPNSHLDYQLFLILEKLIKRDITYAEKISKDFYEYCSLNIHNYPATYYWYNLLPILFDIHYEIIWNKYLGKLFLQDVFAQLFIKNMFSNHKVSIICNNLEKINKMIKWCKANIDKEPQVCMARNIQLFNKKNEIDEWSDAILELLKEYDDKNFLDAIISNLSEYCLANESVSSYYKRCAKLLSKLKGHYRDNIEKWLTLEIDRFNKMADNEARLENEHSILFT